METITKCLICGKERFEVYMECIDLFLTNEKFTIVECESCGFRFTNPRPEQSHIAKYYASEEYVSHSATNKGLINKIYLYVRKYTHKKKFNLVNKYKKNGKILDIGCASGELLAVFKNHKWETFGIEENSNARQSAHDNFGLNVSAESEILKFDERFFDVIMMWHVLEHVHDIDKLMTNVLRILKPDGVFIVAVPMCESYDAVVYKNYWAAYDVPRHLYHFTDDSLRGLMSKYNLEIKKILPMKFDSYYVSMLSEKYTNKKNNYLKAFRVGSLSNRMAKLKISPYSSQIFIIKLKN